MEPPAVSEDSEASAWSARRAWANAASLRAHRAQRRRDALVGDLAVL